MMVQAKAFNIYFCLALAIGLATGCKTSPEDQQKKKDKKLATVLRLHLEMRPDNSGGQETISVIRNSPVQISVKKTDFLNEANIAEAAVVDTLGGFSITLKFDRRGRLLLEQYTSANVGRRIAVYAQFGEGLKQSRWLGAPVIRKHVGDGVLTFTPDCSREEADQIVRGLNNVAKKVQSKNDDW
jgi:preprotein translocase subunit SecD